jgi:hypothetical protein
MSVDISQTGGFAEALRVVHLPRYLSLEMPPSGVEKKTPSMLLHISGMNPTQTSNPHLFLSIGVGPKAAPSTFQNSGGSRENVILIPWILVSHSYIVADSFVHCVPTSCPS